MNFKWYILFVRKNYELKVIKDFNFLISLDNFSFLKERISEIKFLEHKDRTGLVKNLIPGYMFVNCNIDKDVINFIYSIKEVVGFLNYDRKNLSSMPSPLSNIEVNNFFHLLNKEENTKTENRKKPSKTQEKKSSKEEIKLPFVIGDIVIVKEGIFRDNQGSIIQINKNLLTVNIEFLGRFTPVSIDASYCEKI